MSWGYKITILYAGFVLLIAGMVTLSVRQKVDLEADDYYEQELKFQSRIDEIKRTEALNVPLAWEVRPGAIQLKFPPQFEGQQISGSIYFLRPSDATLDKTIPVRATTSTVQSIPTLQLKSGIYKMQLSWRVNNTDYYNEGIINIR